MNHKHLDLWGTRSLRRLQNPHGAKFHLGDSQREHKRGASCPIFAWKFLYHNGIVCPQGSPLFVVDALSRRRRCIGAGCRDPRLLGGACNRGSSG